MTELVDQEDSGSTLGPNISSSNPWEPPRKFRGLPEYQRFSLKVIDVNVGKLASDNRKRYHVVNVFKTDILHSLTHPEPNSS